MTTERKKLGVPDLALRKKAGEKVVMASIPDYPWLFGPGGQASTSPPFAMHLHSRA